MRLALKWFYILQMILFRVESSEFFALLIGDTSEKSIANVVKYDIKAMKAEVRYITKCTGQKLNLYVLQGSSINQENLEIALHQINPGKDDTVLFYQSSHGFRSPDKKDRWPILFYNSSNLGIYFESVNNLLLNKNPRLLISIVNACNSKTPQELMGSENRLQIIVRSKRLSDSEMEIYQQLFSVFRGSIIASSSRPGQQSFGFDKGGSFFTMCFIEALKKAAYGAIGCQWQDVMRETAVDTKRRAKNFDCAQHPQFVIKESVK